VKWAPRASIHIDRAACAWLIRRHVDTGAEFVFVSDPAELPAGAAPFDMRGVGARSSRRGLQLRDDPAPL